MGRSRNFENSQGGQALSGVEACAGEGGTSAGAGAGAEAVSFRFLILSLTNSETVGTPFVVSSGRVNYLQEFL